VAFAMTRRLDKDHQEKETYIHLRRHADRPRVIQGKADASSYRKNSRAMI
jgi:hypothetical protein